MQEELDTLRQVPEAGAEVRARPGIFYEELQISQEIYEQEHRPPEPGLFQDVPKLPVLLCCVLLLLLMVTALFAGRAVDPDASAIAGNGVSLTNREFAVYYWNAYRAAVSEAQEQDTELPFDTAEPLDRQYYNLETGETWQDYFMEQAAEQAALVQCLSQEAKNNGFILSEAGQEAFGQQLEMLEQLAAAGGYLTAEGQGDVDAYVRQIYGPDVSAEVFRQYLFDSRLSSAYAVYISQTLAEEGDGTEALETYCDALLEQYQCRLTPLADIPPLTE